MSDALDTLHNDALESAALASRTFAGQRLEPFSFSRKALLQRMRCWESPAENDVAIVYVCTLADDAVDDARGEGVRKARIEMGRWAEKQRIGLTGKARGRIATIAADIWAEYEAAEAEPEGITGASPNGAARAGGLPTT